MHAARFNLLSLSLLSVLACSAAETRRTDAQLRFRSAVDRARDHRELLALIVQASEADAMVEATLLRHLELCAGAGARREVERYLDRAEARLQRILDAQVPQTAEQLFLALKSHWLELNLRYADSVSPKLGPAAVAEGSCMLRLARRSEGSCVDVSSLYLCLAERLHLPLFLVVVPTHQFLRIQKGGKTVIFEGTHPGWGKERTENTYVRRFGTGEAPPGNASFYFKSLSKREAILATVFDETSALWIADDRFEDVLRLCDAVEPVLGPEAYLNKRYGALMLLSADFNKGEVFDPARLRQAMEYIERDLSLYPHNDLASTLLLRGTTMLKERTWSRAAAERVLRNPRLSDGTRREALDILKDQAPPK
jgi:hypothetical protein